MEDSLSISDKKIEDSELAVLEMFQDNSVMNKCIPIL